MPTLELTTALGSPFDVRRFSVAESVSDPFHVEIIALAADPDIDLDAIVGKPGSFTIVAGYAHARGGARSWSGVVSFAERVHGVTGGGGGSRAMSTYQIRIEPDVWLLTQRTNHRIFQHKSIPDIVDQLLGEWGLPPKWRVDRGDYPKLEYKAQYGETDYAFLSRLLEEAGIAYTLTDRGEGTELILSDKLHSHPVRPHPPIHFVDNPSESAEQEFVTAVRLSNQVRPGAHHIVDYDFRNPSFRLTAEAPKAPSPEDRYEHYEYRPGSFLVEGGRGGGTPVADDKGVARHEAGYGRGRAERSLHATRTGRRSVVFETNVADLAPGMVFTIEHPSEDLSKPLLVLEKRIDGAANEKWEMIGRAVFAEEVYRPARRTEKPRIWGVQSATVVGPPGQEIHTDEFGRVRVQFPWDREGRYDDDSTCWVRVSQGWSGTGFGMINIPRVGQEVLIAFLDGDPDQPVVVGRVFNAVQPVPYKLPENKTVSAWRTASSPATGGYNEIKLEDAAQKEFIYIQAQRDLHELVKRDETKRVERNHHRTIAANQDLVVKLTKRELIEADDHLHVKGNRMQKIDGSTSLTVGVDQDEKIGNKHAVEAGREIHLKAGDHVVIEAGTRLTIKGPGGFVDIHAGGIDIVGTMVKINSGGSAGAGSGASPEEPADAEEAQPRDTSVD